MNSNQAYHAYTKRATNAAAGIDKAEKDVALFAARSCQLAAAKERLAKHRHDTKGVSIAAGKCFTVVCTSAGAVFTFGGHGEHSWPSECEEKFASFWAMGRFAFHHFSTYPGWSRRWQRRK